jgi:hypothetical protein
VWYIKFNVLDKSAAPSAEYYPKDGGNRFFRNNIRQQSKRHNFLKDHNLDIRGQESLKSNRSKL